MIAFWPPKSPGLGGTFSSLLVRALRLIIEEIRQGTCYSIPRDNADRMDKHLQQPK